MTGQKRACLVYVTATEALRKGVRQHLEEQGFVVCEVKADIEDALAAQAGAADIPPALADCVQSSDICVFLLPEKPDFDGMLGEAAGLANAMQKMIVGIVCGMRSNYPEAFEDQAQSMVRVGSDRLSEALNGAEIWENPDRTPMADRRIRHIKCQ